MNARPDSREFEYWTPEPIWKDETAFVLASGPSLTAEICEKVRWRKTIAVNSSCMLAPWADVLFFTDSGWYEPRRAAVAGWPGLVISMSRTAKRELPDKVKRVKGEGDPALPPRFPPPGAGVVQQGRSSGHTAISVAVALGARRVALLGYDMRVVADREHCHQEYTGPRDLGIYANDFVPAFNGWRAAAEAVGVEIINCTPGSAIAEFSFADLDQVLG